MNANVVLAITIAVLSVWAGAATQLDTLVGHTISTIIVALSNLTVASLAAALGVLSAQGRQVSNVAAMPGVSKIVVNDQANSTLASLTVGPGTSSKIEAENPDTKEKLKQTVAAANS